MNRAQKLIAILGIFGVIAALGYWIYLYVVEGEAPSLGDVWAGAKGAATSVTGIGKMNFDDLVTLASGSGFATQNSNDASEAQIAAAIALAESSGNPSAVGDLKITPGGSVGLWQINLKAHPDLSTLALTDPQTNANAAYSVFKEQGWTAWSTYNSGAYLNHMPAASAPVTVDTSDATAYSSEDTASQGGS